MRARWILTGGSAVALSYFAALRPWHVRWGTTAEERARRMPLDERIRDPLYVTNRAITICAKPEDIWPWLAQMGELPRGGFYSYTFIEHLLGMRVENADRILPEYQELRAGETIDRAGNMYVHAVKPFRWLVLGSNPRDPHLAATWAMAIYPLDGERSRLVSRVRVAVKKASLGTILGVAVVDPGQFIMERKMLVEIRKRAEALALHRRRSRPRATGTEEERRRLRINLPWTGRTGAVETGGDAR